MLCSASLVVGKDLEFIQIPKIQKIQGEEAIIALQSFVTELEHNKERKLTKKQKRALIKIADSLITSIKEEMPNKKDKKAVQTFSEQGSFALFKRIFPWIPR
jgi:adenylosuccinate synthase